MKHLETRSGVTWQARCLAVVLLAALACGLTACATTEVEVRGQYDTVFGRVKRPG